LKDALAHLTLKLKRGRHIGGIGLSPGVQSLSSRVNQGHEADAESRHAEDHAPVDGHDASLGRRTMFFMRCSEPTLTRPGARLIMEA
jgi:hypothetical protein